MAFQKKRLRQSQVPDFRVSFLGIKDGKAKIGINSRSVSNYVETPSANFELISFYSTVISPYTTSLGVVGRAKEMSHFIPAHTNDPRFSSLEDPILRGGEFLIPLETVTYFWMQVPGQYSDKGEYSPNYDDLDNGIKLNFGPEIPKMDPPKKRGTTTTYKMYVPLFQITVNKDAVETVNYDPGELVFLSMNAINDRKIIDLSKMSSYYDT
jgi:hypothetical protein